MCTLYTRQIKGGGAKNCGVAAGDPSLVLRFPCKTLNGTAGKLAGPSLNLWARFMGEGGTALLTWKPGQLGCSAVAAPPSSRALMHAW